MTNADRHIDWSRYPVRESNGRKRIACRVCGAPFAVGAKYYDAGRSAAHVACVKDGER